MALGFVELLIAASVLIALAVSWSVNRALRRGSELGGLLIGVLVGAGTTCAAVAFVMIGLGPDFLAAAHLVYAVLTISAPLAAIITLATKRRASLWFRLVLLCVSLAALIGIYASFVEPFWLRVDRVDVPISSSAAVDLRIGVLSDLQTDSIGDYERSAVDALLDEKPDLVLIPGDFWQMSTTDFERRAPQFAAVMKRLSDAVPHVAVVRGDTDNRPGLRRITADTGVMLLDNVTTEIDVDGTTVRILGISRDGDEFRLVSAFERFFAPSDNLHVEPIRIVLAHRPDEIDRFAPTDVLDLLVAGHTHGGQVAIPFLGPPFTNSTVPRSIAAGGLHQLDGHTIYVSTGVGRERGHAPRVRFGVRPSIGVLRLATAP